MSKTTWTPSMSDIRLASHVAVSISAIGIFMCICVIVCSFLLWKNPRTFSLVDRLSFKLILVCVMCSIPYEIGYMTSSFASSRSGCNSAMWVVSCFYNTMNFLMGCISLNMLLAIYFQQVFQYPVSRYYFAGSITIGIVMGTIPIPLQGYSWSESLQSCWMASNSWDVGIIYTPVVVVCILMIACTSAVAYKLLWSKRRRSADAIIQQLYKPFETLALGELEDTVPEISTMVVTSRISMQPLDKSTKEEPHEVLVAKLPMTLPTLVPNPYEADQKVLRQTVFRVAIYPFTHTFVAFLGVFAQVLLLANPSAGPNYLRGLYIQQFVGPAAIPIAYSLCAFVADPAFIQGIPLLFALWRAGEMPDSFDIEQCRCENEKPITGPRPIPKAPRFRSASNYGMDSDLESPVTELTIKEIDARMSICVAPVEADLERMREKKSS